MDRRTLLDAVLSDGRFLLIFTALILVLSGLFVIIQSITGHFLPHDISYLGLDAQELSSFSNGSITKFMFHDRISFGGSIIAVGFLYMWLAEFPLKNKEPWAWYLFLFSGLIGFGSFLTYLGYGYLDTWHGVATLLLLPFFITGLIRSYSLVRHQARFKDAFLMKEKVNLKNRYGIGKLFLLFSSLGILSGGVTIMIVGMTTIFVPQDLEYMSITVCGIEKINENLKPLIAHDRAAFGGGLATIGLLYFFIIRRSDPTINLWQILLLSLTVGFSTAIGVHFFIGYTSFTHLLPAYFGAATSAIGLTFTYSGMHSK
jgi:MFS family permease